MKSPSSISSPTKTFEGGMKAFEANLGLFTDEKLETLIFLFYNIFYFLIAKNITTTYYLCKKS
jgi:hypothetical protein